MAILRRDFADFAAGFETTACDDDQFHDDDNYDSSTATAATTYDCAASAGEQLQSELHRVRAQRVRHDCAGGSGDGPAYTGPVRVTGTDVCDLDADSDGFTCE